MKTILTMVVLGSFIGLAVFGVAQMHHNEHTFSCLAATINGGAAPCPQADAFGFAAFHIDAFQSFVSSTMTQSIFVQLMLLSALAILAVFGVGNIASPAPAFSVPLFPAHNRSPHQKTALLSWFALHENSPAVR